MLKVSGVSSTPPFMRDSLPFEIGIPLAETASLSEALRTGKFHGFAPGEEHFRLSPYQMPCLRNSHMASLWTSISRVTSPSVCAALRNPWYEEMCRLLSR